MSETKRVIDLKKKELREELQRPERYRNNLKIRRLQESIDRHKIWEYRKSRKRRRIKSIELKGGI